MLFSVVCYMPMLVLLLPFAKCAAGSPITAHVLDIIKKGRLLVGGATSPMNED